MSKRQNQPLGTQHFCEKRCVQLARRGSMLLSKVLNFFALVARKGMLLSSRVGSKFWAISSLNCNQLSFSVQVFSMGSAMCGRPISFVHLYSCSCNLRDLHSDGVRANKKARVGGTCPSNSNGYVEVLHDDAFLVREGETERQEGRRMQTLLPPCCGSGTSAAELRPGAIVCCTGHRLSGQDGRGSDSTSSVTKLSRPRYGRTTRQLHAQIKEGGGNARLFLSASLSLLCPVGAAKSFSEV